MFRAFFSTTAKCRQSIKAVFLLFFQSVIRTEGGTTSGMLCHLKTMHTEVYLDAVATKNNADGLGYVVNPQAVPKTQTRKKF
jgi:uncharacterized membrane protein YqgA involved in biofilm formation